MTSKTIKNLLFTLACGVSMECHAMEESVFDSVVNEKSPSKRVYGHQSDTGHKSLEFLKETLGADHLSADHLIVKSLQTGVLPSSVDLTQGYPDPFDQGQLGSCTANALVGVTLFELLS